MVGTIKKNYAGIENLAGLEFKIYLRSRKETTRSGYTRGGEQWGRWDQYDELRGGVARGHLVKGKDALDPT